MSKVHCFHCSSQSYVITVQFTGNGYSQYSVEYNSSEVSILFISDNLTQFLLFKEYHLKEITATEDKIASIIITTTSSTRVNQFLFLTAIIFEKFYKIYLTYSNIFSKKINKKYYYIIIKYY
jgi:hypothetical protein